MYFVLPIHLVGTDVSLKDNFASISCEWVISFFNTSWNFLMSCHLLLHSSLCATFRMDTLALLPQLYCTAHILCVKAICCPTGLICCKSLHFSPVQFCHSWLVTHQYKHAIFRQLHMPGCLKVHTKWQTLSPGNYVTIAQFLLQLHTNQIL